MTAVIQGLDGVRSGSSGDTFRTGLSRQSRLENDIVMVEVAHGLALPNYRLPTHDDPKSTPSGLVSVLNLSGRIRLQFSV
jgi:hypothetical protein